MSDKPAELQPEDVQTEATTEGAQPEVEDPRDATIQALIAERDGLKDQLLRTLAEAQNIQKRMRQQMEQERRFAGEALVRELLPVLDSFERAIAAAEKGQSAESLLDGVRAIEKLMRKALESSKVSRIVSVGAKFDPEVHEALVTHASEEHEDDTVTDEIQAGYTMHGKVIRPARVRVAKKP